MILRPFLSNQPLSLVLLIPIIAGFHLLNYFFPYHLSLPYIDLGLWGKASHIDAWWISFPTAAMVALNAFQITRLFNKHEFLERYNYGPSLFYVVLMSFSHSFYQLDGLLFVHVFLLQAIRILFTTRPNEDHRKEAFNAFFFIGLAATFLTPTTGLIIFFWFAFWALKSFVFKEFVLSILGFAFPVFNALMYWWFSGHQIGLNVLRHATFIKNETLVYYATSAAVLILFVLSIIGVQVRLQKSSIRFKKLNRSLVWILIGTSLLGISDLIIYQQVEWFNTIFIPLSFFFTFAFIHKFWKIVATWFFYATLLLAVVKFFLTSFTFL